MNNPKNSDAKKKDASSFKFGKVIGEGKKTKKTSFSRNLMF